MGQLFKFKAIWYTAQKTLWIFTNYLAMIHELQWVCIIYHSVVNNALQSTYGFMAEYADCWPR